MNNILKSARLDFFLVLPYSKRIILADIIMPVFYTFTTGSILSGVSFTMCMAAILSCYTFSVSEKNGMEKLYGVLPVTKKELVLGRYVFTCLMGLFSLIMAIILHPAFLLLMKKECRPADVIISVIAGILTFSLYTVIQLPGYYKYGALRARVFMYVPLVGFFAFLYLLGSGKRSLTVLLGHPAVLAFAAVLLFIGAYAVSIALSIKFLEKKEL